MVDFTCFYFFISLFFNIPFKPTTRFWGLLTLPRLTLNIDLISYGGLFLVLAGLFPLHRCHSLCTGRSVSVEYICCATQWVGCRQFLYIGGGGGHKSS